MTINDQRVEEFFEDRWVVNFDKETEMEILRRLDDLLIPNGVFWDVGAHAGLYSIIGAQLYRDLDVYSFEPSEYTRTEILQDNVRSFENVTVLPHLLADVEGTLTFLDTHEGHTTNSLQSTALAPDGSEAFDVQSHTARSIVDERSVPKPDVVKIDVEGAEHRVLRGFDRELLAGVSTVICELHHIGDRDTETVPYLREHDFSVEIVNERETEDGEQEHILATRQ